jgi:transcriptional regulator with XRE-family HTH domain
MRHYYGYSQEELASKMEVTRQTISRWERGETSPNLEELDRLANILRLSLNDFVMHM